jgi:hypothetical protein
LRLSISRPGTRLASAGSDVVFVKAMQPDKHQDYVGQASRRYQRPAFPAFPALPALPAGANSRRMPADLIEPTW